jgi:molybdopterin converting factor small subunit
MGMEGKVQSGGEARGRPAGGDPADFSTLGGMARRVRIRYYAQLRDALGAASEEVEIDFPARESDILERLCERHPRQRALLLASRVAVGDGYVAAGSAVETADEMDIISPISGG